MKSLLGLQYPFYQQYRSPVSGIHYLDIEWFCPQHGTAVILKGLSLVSTPTVLQLAGACS